MGTLDTIQCNTIHTTKVLYVCIRTKRKETKAIERNKNKMYLLLAMFCRLNGNYHFESESGREFIAYGFTGACSGDSGSPVWKQTTDKVKMLKSTCFCLFLEAWQLSHLFTLLVFCTSCFGICFLYTGIILYH